MPCSADALARKQQNKRHGLPCSAILVAKPGWCAAAMAHQNAVEVPVHTSDEGEDSGSEPAASGGGGAGEPSWLGPVLRMLAETQRELVSRAGPTGPMKPKTALASLKLEEFRGGRETTTHQYRSWRKQVLIVQRLYGLSDPEMALLIYTQVKGRAKQLLEVLEVTDLEKPEGLAMVWAILDRAHERMEHERADDAYSAWESARRKPGQSIEEWLTYLRKVRLELEAQDPNIVISEKQHASKMMRGAMLPHDKKAQVLFNCGGVYDPLRMETVLRATFPKIGDTERKLGLVVP